MTGGAWTRRGVLASLGGAVTAPVALAFGEATTVDLCELDLGPGTLARPLAWRRLLYELHNTTSVECRVQPAPRCAPDDPALFEHPFAVVVGEAAFADPSDAAVERLGRFLAYGGTLLLDDATGADDSPFARAAVSLVGRLFPTRPLAPVPPEHSIFRSFFLLERPVGRVDRVPWVEGVSVGGHTPVFLFRNDLSGALDHTAEGRPRQACVPGGERQRREAFKLGINLLMYALTADYKKDIAHTRQLMLEGRLE